jgi:SAM-dependent methyltransferase
MRLFLVRERSSLTDVGLRNEENRTSWLKTALEEIPAGSRILDAGAGERKYEQFCSHLNYVAHDFGRYDGTGDGAGIQTGKWDQTRLDIISDIVAIPENDDSFDAIMCVEVLEHLPEPIEAIREFARLLKPGGYLVITAPFCSLSHFAPYHFYSGFNRYFFEHHLAAHGFEIADFQVNGNYFEYLAQELRRLRAVAARYSNARMTLVGRLSVRLLLPLLAKLSSRDRGSGELLSFGCHVKAKKC